MAGNGKNKRPKSNESTGRDYTYDKKYQKKKKGPGSVEDRADRGKARSLMEKAGKVRKGDGKDVDHIKTKKAGGTSKRSNLRVLSASENRAAANRKKRTKTKRA
jgi:hypothetical protein